MSDTHECVFVEEQEPSGRLILPPCIVCGFTAMDALDQLRRDPAPTDNRAAQGLTPCRRNATRNRWECITWPNKPTAYACGHDHTHCDHIGCVEHVDGMHVDYREDAIVHVGCHICRPDRPDLYPAPTDNQRDDELADRVRALADEWASEGDDLIRNCYSGRDVDEGEQLKSCAAALRAVVDGATTGDGEGA